MNTICSICSEDLFVGEAEEESINSTICGHLYHCQCLLQWMERSKTCPICRLNLENKPPIKLNFTYGDIAAKTIRITDLEKRLKQLSNSESDLKRQLDVKREKFRRLVENNREVNSALEMQSHELRQLLQIKEELENELAQSRRALQESEENHTSAVLACEELRTKNMILEDQVHELSTAKSDLKAELRMKNEELEQIIEIRSNLNLANEQLSKEITEYEERVQKILNIQSNLENNLEKKIQDLECWKAYYKEMDLRCENLRARNNEIEKCMHLFVDSRFIMQRRLALNTILLKEMDEKYTNVLRENENLKTKTETLYKDLEKFKINLMQEQRVHNAARQTNEDSENVQQQLRKQIETLKGILKTEQEKNYAMIQEFRGLRTLETETLEEEIETLREEIVKLRAELSSARIITQHHN